MNLRLRKVDLSRADRHELPPGVDPEGKTYLARWGGDLYIGTFERVHFGLHFDCGWGASGGFQFDAPGSNCSLWEGLWELVES